MTGLSFHDNRIGRIGATMVPSKSNGHTYNSSWGVKQIEDTGYANAICRTDNEPTLIEFRRFVIAKSAEFCKLVPEGSKVADSQTNGAIECANLILENKIRTNKDNLDSNYSRKFETPHPIISWLVPYSAVTYNLFHVDLDGRTPYEKHRKRRINIKLPEFAENIYFKLHKGKGSKLLKLEMNYQDGIFSWYCRTQFRIHCRRR